jgi:hypothetical protein
MEGEKTNVPLDSTREWAKAPPHARLLLLPNAGHATFIDQPEALLREIEVFLQGGWPANSKEMEKQISSQTLWRERSQESETEAVRADRFVFLICNRRSMESLPGPVRDKAMKAIR